MRPKFRIGLVQMSCSADPEENLEKAVVRIRDAAARGAQIVCLQELFRSQYFCRTEDAARFDLAEPIPGPSTAVIGRIAKETGTVVVASLFERRAAGLYHNTAAVLNADGALLGLYRKMHIPDDPLYYEKFYFTPGDLGFRNFDTAFGRIGVLICWDAEHGASQLAAWQTIQRSHAIANGIYVAAVNRIGLEGAPGDDLEFWGHSFVSDPFGVVVAEASQDREETLVVECDPAHAEEVRRDWPFFRDRRVDAFGPITSRWLGEE
jgi:N-carbamoylputrescine amidase